MNRFHGALIVIVLVLLPLATAAQTDELREATGLPIQIGQPAIYGQVVIKKLNRDDKKPVVHVSLLEGGSQIGRVQTNDAGYYYFLTAPRGNDTLVFEVDNNEVGRVILNAAVGVSRNIRQDFTIDWAEFQRRNTVEIISTKDAYPRTPESDKAFANAMLRVKEKKFDQANVLLQDILAKDPKDFVAWTELGTSYFKQSSLDNAEACYFKAIELKKDYFLALINLGQLYIERRQFDNAILVLSNAVKVSHDSADAHHFLGEAYLQVKKGSSAEFHFKEALRLSPMEKADVHLRLAALYDAAGLKGKASSEYKLFLVKRPDYSQKAQLEKYIADNPPK